MFCVNCGSPNEAGARFCIKCGSPLSGATTPDAVPPPPPAPGSFPPPPMAPAGQLPKSKLTAGILGIFLGWLGIHRFYLGYQNIAVAQLAVGLVGLVLSPFTCGLILTGAAIWGLVDGIMILTGSVPVDGQGRPLAD